MKMIYGTVYTYTVINMAPERFRQFTPYACVIVQLSDGKRVVARLTGASKIDGLFIGKEVNISEEE
jgi:uncharacterized OB-fold protein